MPTTLTLPETVDLAQRVLDANKVAPASKRAAPELSARVVRWYASSGILDGPGRSGHSATYGRRHLLQLLYTRQAQAKGVALEQIRSDLFGQDDAGLATLVDLDLSLVPQDLGDVSPRKEGNFWEREPALGAGGVVEQVTNERGERQVREADLLALRGNLRAGRRYQAMAAVSAFAPSSALVSHSVRMGPVTIDVDHEPSAGELALLEGAAESLLSALAGMSDLTAPTTRRIP